MALRAVFSSVAYTLRAGSLGLLAAASLLIQHGFILGAGFDLLFHLFDSLLGIGFAAELIFSFVKARRKRELFRARGFELIPLSLLLLIFILMWLAPAQAAALGATIFGAHDLADRLEVSEVLVLDPEPDRVRRVVGVQQADRNAWQLERAGAASVRAVVFWQTISIVLWGTVFGVLAVVGVDVLAGGAGDVDVIGADARRDVRELRRLRAGRGGRDRGYRLLRGLHCAMPGRFHAHLLGKLVLRRGRLLPLRERLLLGQLDGNDLLPGLQRRLHLPARRPVLG